MTVFADTLAWVGAGASVVSAVVGFAALYAVFKWFRPKFVARIDERRQAIRLDVVNNGRAAGRVRKVAPVDKQSVELDARYAGLKDSRFVPAEISGHSTWLLILEAQPQTGAFPPGTRLLVAWGRRKQRALKLESTHGVSYHGMESDWPR